MEAKERDAFLNRLLTAMEMGVIIQTNLKNGVYDINITINNTTQQMSVSRYLLLDGLEAVLRYAIKD